MKKISIKDQGQFFIRASNMLKNGYTFIEIFQFFTNTQERHGALYSSMMRGLEEGEPIHKVFISHSFDTQVCATIYFAEKHGYLIKSFSESGQYLLKKEEQKKKLMKLIQYPSILIFALLFVAFILKAILLPQFQLLYNTIGFKPSGFTRIIFHIIDYIPIYVGIFLSFCLLLSLFAKRQLRQRTAFEVAAIQSSIPFYQSFYRLYQTVFFAREWSLLFQSGHSLSEIIQMMETQEFSSLMKEVGAYLKNELIMGRSFPQALAKLDFLTEELVIIAEHGEKSGRMGDELYYYSQICIEMVEEKMLKYMSIIQPVIFCLIGLVVTLIYMSIFLPMFQMMDSI